MVRPQSVKSCECSALNTKIKQSIHHQQSRYIFPPYPSLAQAKINPCLISDSNIKVKRIWPPAPAVEDEKTSLAKEANPSTVEDDIYSEVQSRGTVDQFPIILDANEHWEDIEAQLNDPASANYEALWTSSTTRPPATRNKKQPRRRQGIAPIISDIPLPPILMERESSPYVFTPRTHRLARTTTDAKKFDASNEKSSSMPILQSLNVMKEAEAGTTSLPLALRGSGRPRNPSSSTTRSSNEDFTEDCESSSAFERDWKSTRHSSLLINQRDGGRHCVTGESFRESGSQTSLTDAKVRALQEGRRIPGASMPPSVLLQHASEDRPSRTLPVRELLDTPSTAVPAAPLCSPTVSPKSGEYSRARPIAQSQAFSQPNLPLSSSPENLPSLSHSSSNGLVNYHGDLRKSGRSTAPNSRTTSRAASPVPSHTSPWLEDTRRRSSYFPLPHDERSHAPSRLASMNSRVCDGSVEPGSLVFTAAVTTKTASSVPYPIADVAMMPSEDDHKFRKQSLGTPSMPRNTTKSLASYEFDHARQLSSRPNLETRRTFTGQYPGTAVLYSPQFSRTVSSSAISLEVSQLARTICPRPRPVAGYDDWYILDGCPNFDICPTCYMSNFWNTSFRNHFTRGFSKHPSLKTKCDYGSQWVRTAWLLILEQQRNNLKLMYAVAHVDAYESACPGIRDDGSTWYTIVDRRGRAIREIHICLCDVKKIQVLLPSLRNCFVRNDHAIKKQGCHLRSDSTRFRDYLDILVAVDAKAHHENKQADLSCFIDFVRQKFEIRECPRDEPLRNAKWHFLKSLPEFTVCEDCYHSMIQPAKRDGPSFALQFSHTPTQLPHETSRGNRRSSDGSAVYGTSCQLYSPRMRAVFDKAVNTDDVRFLAQKARQRKDGEMELRQQELRLQFEEDHVIDALANVGIRSDWRTQPRYAGLKMDFERLDEAWRLWE